MVNTKQTNELVESKEDEVVQSGESTNLAKQMPEVEGNWVSGKM